MIRVCLLFMLSVSLSVNAADDWEKFAKLPIVEQPQVSPDGQSIATLYNSEDGPSVAIAPFGTVEFAVVAKLKKNRDRLDFIRWSGNKFLIIGTSYPEYVGGQHYRVKRLYRVNVKENTSRVLSNRKFEASEWYRYRSFMLISALKDDEDYALISTYDESDQDYSVFKVNLETSTFEKVQNNHEDISNWEADVDGVIRLGLQVEKKDNLFVKHIWYRAKAGDELKNIHTQVTGKESTFDIIGLTDDGTKAYVISDRETRFQSLWLYNIITGEFEEKLFSVDGYDIASGLKNSQGDLIGVSYYDDFYRTHYFSDVDAEQGKAIRDLFKGKEVFIASKSADKQRLLVLVESDNSVPAYYWLDLKTQKGGPWLAKYPYLARRTFPHVENIQFTAKDGAAISGYLTMPEGIEKPKLVVMPHGGPNARDYKYFDPLVQYIASLGYAVLQVNFRGSSGFGSDFETDGYYEWGKLMQQDVYDGMDWLLSTGRVSDEACAVGGSYGGYWALTAAFQQPYRFKCIVSIAGLSDLQDFVQDIERMEYFAGNIVHQDDEAQMKKDIVALADVSVINHIDRLKAPILLIHGDNDTRVPFQQSKKLYEQARRDHKVEYIELKDGTHFFDDADAKKAEFKNVGRFLQKHL